MINGDIGNHHTYNRELNTDNIHYVFLKLKDSGLLTYFQPGSHESIEYYGDYVQHFSKRYASKIFDVLTLNDPIVFGDYNLVFLPGSETTSNGDYLLNCKDSDGNFLKTGYWIETTDRKMYEISLGDLISKRIRNVDKVKRFFHNKNSYDLLKTVTKPEKTIVICHDPRRFDNLETCVDYADFGQATESFELYENGRKLAITKGAIFPYELALGYSNLGHPIEVKHENRGSLVLKDVFDELGIKFAISDHFHESGHKANDLNGKSVLQNTPLNELFWNPGSLSSGQVGILKIHYGNVSYQNYNV